MIDIMGTGDAFEEQQDDKAIDRQEAQKVGIDKENIKESGKPTETRDEVVGVPDSWDTAAPPKEAAARAQSPAAWADDEGDKGLLKVLKAFKILQEEFNGKFKKMWA